MAKDKFTEAMVAEAKGFLLKVTMITAALEAGQMDFPTFAEALGEAMEELIPEGAPTLPGTPEIMVDPMRVPEPHGPAPAV